MFQLKVHTNIFCDWSFVAIYNKFASNLFFRSLLFFRGCQVIENLVLVTLMTIIYITNSLDNSSNWWWEISMSLWDGWTGKVLFNPFSKVGLKNWFSFSCWIVIVSQLLGLDIFIVVIISAIIYFSFSNKEHFWFPTALKYLRQF